MQLREQQGFTLFEVLIYIGLFSMIMVAAIGGAFLLIDGAVKTRSNIVLENEANFVFRKIDYALNGRVNVSMPARGLNGNMLTIDGEFFEIDSGAILYDGEPITSTKITVESFYVERSPFGEPDAVSIGFVFDHSPNDKSFATSTRYIR